MEELLKLLEKERLSNNNIDEKKIPQLLYEIEVLKAKIQKEINLFL